ncbi:MAG: DUF192 domain-containing protein [Cyanobacteriota bacterium]|nr:DUF192 domain-containing protein [Cyanobacteriota bacterium]
MNRRLARGEQRHRPRWIPRRGWPLAGLLAGVWCVADGKADPGETSPPQRLPIEARWCLSERAPSRCIDLEVPKTPRQFSMGLQMRPALPPLRGMWFAFEPPAVAKFWMHRTLAPLDLLFIADGRILAIEANAPTCPHLPCPSYGPDGPVEGVVELGAGEAQRLGLKVGQPVRIQRIGQPATPSTPARD